MSELGAYLAAARTKPWRWRSHDCTAFPAIWAGFADALPPYASEAEAEALLHEAGGLALLWERAVAARPGKAADITPDEREPGDVGVIEMIAPDLTQVEVGAIWTGKRWAFAPRRGGVAAIASAACLKAWRPACRR